jgi:hypothetical protein
MSKYTPDPALYKIRVLLKQNTRKALLKEQGKRTAETGRKPTMIELASELLDTHPVLLQV